MTPRRPINQTRKQPEAKSGKVTITLTVTESEGRKIEAIADDLDMSDDTVIHEMIAFWLTKHEVALPDSLVEHLEANGRPLPQGARRAPRQFRCH